MATKFIILSGAYVGPDIVAEFGRLPPAFLPSGTQRLFERQIQLGQRYGGDILLTLPQDFELVTSDERILERNNVTVVRTETSLSLKEATLAAIRIAAPDGRLVLLFGDTLIEPGCIAPDTFATGLTQHFAVWGDYQLENGLPRFHERLKAEVGAREVVAGLFDLSDGASFARNLEDAPSFYSALDAYSSELGLQAERAERWLDFGHLHTFYQSRRADLAARAFNRISSDGYSVRKSGAPQRKIYAEAMWYQSLPPSFRPYVPTFITLGNDGGGEIFYEIEYLHLPTLSELLTFGELPPVVWSGIFQSCRDFLNLCQQTLPQPHEVPFDYPKRFFDDLVIDKTYSRLAAFLKTEGLSETESWTINGVTLPPLRQVLDELVALIGPTTEAHLGLWHGDFHLANMFFDFRSHRIKVIDPRGMLSDGNIALFGDIRYDIAKLTHSVIGLYDFIIAGRFNLSRGEYSLDFHIDVSPQLEKIINDFRSMTFGVHVGSSPEILALTAILFFSMLPLHADNRERQFAFLANAFRVALMTGRF